MINLQLPAAPPALTDSIPDAHEEIVALRSLSFEDLIERLASSMVTFAINLTIAIIVFYVGRLIINKTYKIVSSIFIRRKLDRSLSTFVLSMIRIVLYFILIVTVIGILGIETSSFIAIFASAGVAIGMALSGTLQNFAGGVLILLLKPYKIGDYIEAQGYAGTVREIQIFHTVISTPDNKSIIIPNGGLSTGSLNNWSREDYRRVDWIIGISYGDSVDTARAKILEILADDDRVVKKYIEDDREHRALIALNESKEEDDEPTVEEKPRRRFFGLFPARKKPSLRPASIPVSDADAVLINSARIDRSPAVNVAELADSSVNLKVTAWTHTPFYWSVFYSTLERIYNELPQTGVSFPFPQLDIHNIPVVPTEENLTTNISHK